MSVDGLGILTPEWNAPSNVQAFNTTRQGGVSKAPFDTLNLGLHVNDDPAAVYENRARLSQALKLPADPQWLNQVHGCDVLSVSNALPEATVAGAPAKADAAFTRQPNKVLCVVTADCLPLVITNQEGTELAVVHAGWKGLLNGVIEASLAKFSPTAHFHVWLGPAIGPEKFEVGLDVKEAFGSKNDAHLCAFVPSLTNDEKHYADIYALARQTVHSTLTTATVSITGGDRCTLSESEHFHSYRRDGAASGRMALMAWLSA